VKEKQSVINFQFLHPLLVWHGQRNLAILNSKVKSYLDWLMEKSDLVSWNQINRMCFIPLIVILFL
jgi:hypothetical protein